MRVLVNFITCGYELVCTYFNECFRLNPNYQAILLTIVLLSMLQKLLCGVLIFLQTRRWGLKEEAIGVLKGLPS